MSDRVTYVPVPPPNQATKAGVTLLNGANIRPEPIQWLWDGWLARGKVHVIAGSPGTGKTSVAMALAATMTIGGRWPDGTMATPGEVWIWSGEDDPRDTLVPRLLACGAVMGRIHFIASTINEEGQSRSFDPAKDAELLSAELMQGNTPPSLLIVDPIVSAVAGDSHKNGEVRRALQPLVDLAQSHRCAVIGISHFSKGSAGRDPVERVTGSLAFGALARIVMATAKLPDEQGGGRILARAKNNIGTDTGGFRYELVPVELPSYPGVFTTEVQWGEPLTGGAREILAEAEAQPDDPEERSALDDAVGFLRMMLENGPVSSKRIRIEADEAGHSWPTIRRAQKSLGIEAIREGGVGRNGAWLWQMPAKMLKEPLRCSQKNVSTLAKLEHLRRHSPPQEAHYAETENHGLLVKACPPCANTEDVEEVFL